MRAINASVASARVAATANRVAPPALRAKQAPAVRVPSANNVLAHCATARPRASVARVRARLHARSLVAMLPSTAEDRAV
jgi:hypothetical protein